MDPISALLDAPRARDAFLLRASMSPPWSLRIQDEAALTGVAMARGTSVWERAGEVFPVGTGDVVLLTDPSPFSFSNAFKRGSGVSPTAYRSLGSGA